MAYAVVADLRTEGVTDPPYSDAEVQAAIDFASEYVERITGQFFEATTDTRVFDGTGTKRLVLDVPLLSLTSVEWLQFGDSWSNVTSQNTFRLYNRIPQDQNYPKLEIYSSRDNIQTDVFGVFPEGAQNIRIAGSWGFVENTGTQAAPVYAVPRLIHKAVKILAVAWMDQIGDGSLLSVLRSYGVVSERTKHHSYQLAEAMNQGALTGIPIVDQILSRYTRKGFAGHV